ncbi:uncharacterized protein [Blastocystis hominis]|uniref:Uncharacterized protein n=1 Tax=Blastocystis hominis TaxID=12968 RepID=D8M9Y5_BLAHO|nr:uncharacterized protein [Blastocystis hominis]CBK24874.2 unnamed protein product [Blastocystis hominis]|eukprot:XP_012898922.1 uncharacterized protein [Blastocystis hominis]
MASDREVKYYLDENLTRISQELTEKENLIRSMQERSTEGMRTRTTSVAKEH